jgi:hypothetical protein
MSIQVDGFKTLLEVHKIANADTVAKWISGTVCELVARLCELLRQSQLAS